MAGENFYEVKAFLKRAADLESMIYSYERTRALLRQTLEDEVSTEARTVKKYKYGDTIPWTHIMPPEERLTRLTYGSISKDKIQERRNYKKWNKGYAKYHSYDEYLVGHTPPDGYPNKKKLGLNSVEAEEEFKRIACACAIFGLILALILRMMMITYHFDEVAWSFAIFTGFAFIGHYVGSYIISKNREKPTNALYLEQKANYEQAVDERNAILSKELGIEAYCIKAEAEIAPVEAKVREELKNHYAKGLLHPKYQNFLAVTQMYGYFDTERCSTLEGKDGAYNLFEQELSARIIISKLDRIIQQLDEIKHAMYELVSAIERTNSLLGMISQDIQRVETAINVNTAAINEFNAETIYALNRI